MVARTATKAAVKTVANRRAKDIYSNYGQESFNCLNDHSHARYKRLDSDVSRHIAE